VGGADEWVDTDGAPGVAAGAGAGTGMPKRLLPDVEVFVHELLAPAYPVQLARSARTWCPQWPHAKAIVRLDALWLARKHLRVEPALGMSVWLRDHTDQVLTSHPDRRPPAA